MNILISDIVLFIVKYAVLCDQKREDGRESIIVTCVRLTNNFQFSNLHFVFRRQPDIATKKTRVKGRDISSAPDVICYGIEGNISCIVKVLHVCLAATVKIYVTNNVHHVIISVCFKRKSSFNTACRYAIFSKLKELNP